MSRLGGGGNGTFPPGGDNNSAIPNLGNSAPTVDVGTVPFDDQNGPFIAPTDGVNADYYIQSHYERDQHTYMAGLTSPIPFKGASVGIFQLAAPTLLWVVDWTAAQWGGMPQIPDTALTDSIASNYQFLDAWFDTVGVNPDGTGQNALYRISGTYFYACLSPSAVPAGDITFPRMPMWQDVFTRTVDLTKLVPNLSYPTGVQQQQGVGVQQNQFGRTVNRQQQQNRVPGG